MINKNNLLPSQHHLPNLIRYHYYNHYYYYNCSRSNSNLNDVRQQYNNGHMFSEVGILLHTCCLCKGMQIHDPASVNVGNIPLNVSFIKKPEIKLPLVSTFSLTHTSQQMVFDTRRAEYLELITLGSICTLFVFGYVLMLHKSLRMFIATIST